MNEATAERYGEVTLSEVLDAREKRAEKQRELLKKYGCPVVCFTMNIAGPVKNSEMIENAFDHGFEGLEKALKGYCIKQLSKEYGKCGPTGYMCVEGDPGKIKKLCISVEEGEPVGRLYDIDVTDIEGNKLSRSKERGCIVCGKQGRACSASRAHSVSDLQAATYFLLRKESRQRNLAAIDGGSLSNNQEK